MSTRIRYSILFVIMTTVVMLISACSQTTTGTTTSSLTPLQVLQNSSNAMQKLKSSHMEIQLTNNIQTSGTNAAATVGTTNPAVTPTVTGTPAPQNLTVSVKGSGDQVLPDQQLNLTVTSLNGTTNLSEVTQGDKLYVKNEQGQWYVLNQSTLQNYVGNPLAGLKLDQNALLGLATQASITDHGTEALNGVNLRHISADLNKDALKQLLNSNPDLKSTLGQQNIDTLIDHTKSFKSTIDVWIDESQFYIHRTQFKLNMLADTAGMGSEVPKTILTNFDTTVDLSKFNQPVTFNVPTNATPTDNPGAVFGIGKP
jgi:uncharacterized protein DUF6612